MANKAHKSDISRHRRPRRRLRVALVAGGIVLALAAAAGWAAVRTASLRDDLQAAAAGLTNGAWKSAA
ncbi:hypothetical protein [Dactylosporangium sp. NPDC048998]|uniref:hypothetical protein n=1 Tax=Dactylosporangium sp. NPDC048998 TaxID=3363976 RepID=UPI00371444CC